MIVAASKRKKEMSKDTGFNFKSSILYRLHWEILGTYLGFKKTAEQISKDYPDRIPMSRVHDLIIGSYTWKGFRDGLVFMQRVDNMRAYQYDKSIKSSSFKNDFDRTIKNDRYDSDLESDIDNDISEFPVNTARIKSNDNNIATDKLDNNYEVMTRKEMDTFQRRKKCDKREQLAIDSMENIKTTIVDGKECYDDVHPDDLIVCPPNWRKYYWKFTIGLNFTIALAILIVRIQSHLSDDTHESVPLDCHLPKYVVLATKYPNIVQMVAAIATATIAFARLCLLSKTRYELDYAIFMVASEQQIRDNLDPEKAKLRYKKIGNLNAIQQCLFYKYLSPGNRIEFRLKPNRSINYKQSEAKSLSLLVFLAQCFLRPGLLVSPLTMYSTLFSFDTFYRGCQIAPHGPLRWYYKAISLILTFFINFEWDELGVDVTVLTASVIKDLKLQRDDLESRLPSVFKAIDQQFDESENEMNQGSHQMHGDVNQQTRYNMDGPMGTYSNYMTSNGRYVDQQTSSPSPSSTKSFFMGARPKSPLANNIDNHLYHPSMMNRSNLYKTRGYQHNNDKLNANYVISSSYGKSNMLSQFNQLNGRNGRNDTLNIYASKSVDESDFSTTNKSFDSHSISFHSKQATFTTITSNQSPREEIADFQSRTLDYFQSLNRADELVSTAYGMIYLFLFMANLTMVLIETSRGWIRGWTYIKLLQALGLPIFLCFMSYVNNLNSMNLRLYRQLCSFMARDTSISKLRWIGLLRYYTDKQRYSFTVFRVEIMSNGLLLKFTSTVLSLTSFMASADFLIGSDL